MDTRKYDTPVPYTYRALLALVYTLVLGHPVLLPRALSPEPHSTLQVPHSPQLVAYTAGFWETFVFFRCTEG